MFVPVCLGAIDSVTGLQPINLVALRQDCAKLNVSATLQHLVCKTVADMDVRLEPTWRYSRRVLQTRCCKVARVH